LPSSPVNLQKQVSKVFLNSYIFKIFYSHNYTWIFLSQFLYAGRDVVYCVLDKKPKHSVHLKRQWIIEKMCKQLSVSGRF
jgi:hypothetical protein